MLALAVTGCHDITPAQAQGGRATGIIVEKVAGGLREPVALAFLPNDIILIAERHSGRIRWLEHGVLRKEPFATVAVPTLPDAPGCGLLGLAVDPDYPRLPFVYAFYTVGDGNRITGQRLVRFTVRDGTGAAETTLVDKLPADATGHNNGGRLLFGADGKLYVAIGDTRHEQQAQDYEALAGKVLRYNRDGTIPADNPFEEQKTATASDPRNDKQQLGGLKTPVYTLGFRNPAGMALDLKSGDIYLADTGPDGHDELDRLAAGDNYGWPQVMGFSTDPHFRQPLWDSGHAALMPSGMAYYTGSALAQYRGDLFFGSTKDGKLRYVALQGRDQLAKIATIPAADSLARLDVAMGRDEYLYFTSLDAVYRLR